MIKDEIKALIQGKNFATISTLLPSGQIHDHLGIETYVSR